MDAVTRCILFFNMASLQQIKRRLLALQGNEMRFVYEALKENEEVILALNRQQMYAGKDSQGNDIRPTYFEDPYFKTPQAAKRYSDWKDRITPSDKRKSGVPNLYINGQFHNSIEVEVEKSGVRTFATSPVASKIKGKFGEVIYGLDFEYRALLKKTTEPVFISKVRAFIKL